MTEKRKVGDKGESDAVNFLYANGYKVVQRNYRFGRSEVDIIAQKDEVMIFIEVKTRGNNSYGYPEEFVTEQQQDRIHLAAEAYISKTGWQEAIRFDIIAILRRGDDLQLDHFEDAF